MIVLADVWQIPCICAFPCLQEKAIFPQVTAVHHAVYSSIRNPDMQSQINPDPS